MAKSALPLDGVLVLDASRMLPGAVLARSLVDLGARLVKVEDPAGGDPLRATPPLVEGTGAAFWAYFRGAESVALDLRKDSDAASLRRLARGADVLVESFRPGTLARWGLDPADLRRTNPGLVTVSLSGFGPGNAWSDHPAHDINFAAMSGLLALLPHGTPRLQLSDVSGAMQALSAILGALLVKARIGAGSHVEQPLATAPMVFGTWAAADAAAGGGSLLDSLFAGHAPAYRLYRAADGKDVAVGALEPKFWTALVGELGLPHLAPDGLDTGERGRAAAREVEGAIAARPAAEWAEVARRAGLPLTAAGAPGEAAGAGFFRDAGFVEKVPLPSGRFLEVPATAPGGTRAAISRPAPALGEGTERVLREFGAVL